MCKTVERRKIEQDSEKCRLSSCTEWCLGKGGGACDQIFVQVRQNGTDVDFEVLFFHNIKLYYYFFY